MKHNFVGTNRNVVPCVKVPDDFKEIIVKILNDKEKKRRRKC